MNRNRRLFTVCGAIITVCLMWIGLAAYISEDYRKTWTMCHTGITEYSQNVFDKADYSLADQFISDTGIHLYVFSDYELPYAPVPIDRYPQTFVLETYRYCAAKGFPLPDWDASQVMPQNSIFVVYGGVMDEGGKVEPYPFYIGSSDLSWLLDDFVCGAFDQSLGTYETEYQSRSLRNFIEILRLRLG